MKKGNSTLTTASLPTRCALDPTATARPLASSISSDALKSFPKSSNLLAPSASAKMAYLPRTCLMPCVTAPPLPLFSNNDTTRMEVDDSPKPRAKRRAVSTVLSIEPSDIIKISQPLGSCVSGGPGDDTRFERFPLSLFRRCTPVIVVARGAASPYCFCKYSTASVNMTTNRSSSLYAGTTSEMNISALSIRALSSPDFDPSGGWFGRRHPFCQQGKGCSWLTCPFRSIVMKLFSVFKGSRGKGATIHRVRYPYCKSELPTVKFSVVAYEQRKHNKGKDRKRAQQRERDLADGIIQAMYIFCHCSTSLNV